MKSNENGLDIEELNKVIYNLKLELLETEEELYNMIHIINDGQEEDDL